MRDVKCAGHDGISVTLAGRSWIMADLAPRQLRKVIPAVIALAAIRAPEDLDETKIDRLLDALYFALTRNYPDLGREEFLDLPIKLTELFAALPALAAAAGVERREGRETGDVFGRTANSVNSSTH